jgi:hypothetical protein
MCNRVRYTLIVSLADKPHIPLQEYNNLYFWSESEATNYAQELRTKYGNSIVFDLVRREDKRIEIDV